MRINIFYSVILLALIGCVEGFELKEKIIGNYYLTAVDNPIDCALSFRESNGSNYTMIIDATVFAVGFNDKFIIAKRHPFNQRTITNYYILPLKRVWDNKGLIGPLTFEQFNMKRKELNIPGGLTFTKVLVDLK